MKFCAIHIFKYHFRVLMIFLKGLFAIMDKKKIFWKVEISHNSKNQHFVWLPTILLLNLCTFSVCLVSVIPSTFFVHMHNVSVYICSMGIGNQSMKWISLPPWETFRLYHTLTHTHTDIQIPNIIPINIYTFHACHLLLFTLTLPCNLSTENFWLLWITTRPRAVISHPKVKKAFT